ncbi:AfsR/SARP family transcriptional regulator [Deinococcus hopiensis]|uniref:Bacterial transcriptional activator domain-containing protein n=1 Tax=Deinococcus hopiensis KR-140 TaxID=695939 RepID=A0A1W1VWC5_9DEIO|nr:hypothetical protein [Deinococcus hopiensis]SMB97553.1 hypothetical protein SAMN00790413_06048 [Deinococcus hopiensis KR-140]
MNMPTWHLQVLGQARLNGPTGTASPVERKLAACLAYLAYLALEGPTSRSRLVGLLWSDPPGATARNNLPQMLRKLRLANGTEFTAGTGEFDLLSGLEVDAARARGASAQARLNELLDLGGEFFQNQRYGDCPDLDGWVMARRERLLEWRTQARRHRAARLARAGDLPAALVHGCGLLDLGPRGFGTESLPGTVRLAREIGRGTVPMPSTPPVGREPPLAVSRPQHLSGRERERKILEQAWQAGQWISIPGEPGPGQALLAFGFAASKGEFTVYSRQSGNRVQSWAALTRTLRHEEERRPDLMPRTKPWVRPELCRFAPEIAPLGQFTAVIASEEDLLRLREAHTFWTAAVHDGLLSNVCDGWQFFGDSTNAVGAFTFGTSFPLRQPGGMPRVVATLQSDFGAERVAEVPGAPLLGLLGALPSIDGRKASPGRPCRSSGGPRAGLRTSTAWRRPPAFTARWLRCGTRRETRPVPPRLGGWPSCPGPSRSRPTAETLPTEEVMMSSPMHPTPLDALASPWGRR